MSISSTHPAAFGDAPQPKFISGGLPVGGLATIMEGALP